MLVCTQVSRVKGAAACFVYEAGHIWLAPPAKKKSVDHGVNLQTHTPVSKISKSTNPTHHWRVNTARGAVAADVVVFATNPYTSAIALQYQDKIVPIRGTCVRIAVPPGSTAPPINSHVYSSPR